MVLCVSHLIDGVLVIKFCFPSCGWGVPIVMFPIQWMGCCPNVCTHLVDGVFGTKCLLSVCFPSQIWWMGCGTRVMFPILLIGGVSK